MKKRILFVIALVFLVLFIDQSLKIWIKLHMTLGESFNVLGLSWFKIYFTENVGMAFGIEFGNGLGKLLLSLFRLLAVSGIGYMIYSLAKSKASYLVLASVALIFAGAFGNIIDSIFYGVLFSESTAFQIATFMPAEGGYAPVLYGKVVDMFYFPLIDTTLPNWLPIWGGERFRFFQAIFNVADAAICIGVGIIILFYRHFFTAEWEGDPSPQKQDDNTSNEQITVTE